MDDEKVIKAIEKMQGIQTYHISVDYVVKAKNIDDATMKVKCGAAEQEVVRSITIITDW